MQRQYHFELKWQASPALSELPPRIGGWLLDPGSFMQRLRAYGAINPRIEVLQQNWQFPLMSEKQILQIPLRQYALVREVLIYSEGKKWMYARTIFPRITLTGEQRSLLRLKNRPLGSVLFKDPAMLREPFDVANISVDSAWHSLITERAKIPAGDLWARRSEFYIHKKPLLLTEVFLPDIISL